MYFSHIRRDLEAFFPAGLSIAGRGTCRSNPPHVNTLHLAYVNPPVAAVLFAVAKRGDATPPKVAHTTLTI